MRALIMQFEVDNPPEHLGTALTKHGVAWEAVRMDLPHEPISLERIDMLMALGGSMHVNDVERFPFVEEAIQAVQTFVNQGRPYLGICLGGQILARALGAEVRANPKPEIGVVPVSLSRNVEDPVLRGLHPIILTMHFHEDTFEVPDDAVLLASSEACPNQIVRYGEWAYGLQFHPEVSTGTFQRWIETSYAKTTGDQNPESRRRIVNDVRNSEAIIRRQADAIMSNFVELAPMARIRN